MAILSSAGATVAIATAFSATGTASAFTNAANGVITVTGIGTAVVGDFVEIVSSPWQRLEGRVFRISNVASDALTLEGCDTSNTTLFPATQGVGTVARRITTWTAVSQVTGIEVSGGEQQFTDITFLSDIISKQFPTKRSPITMRLPLIYDPGLAWVPTIRGISGSSTPNAVRLTGQSGMRMVLNGFVSFLDAPTIDGDVFRGSIDIAGVAIPTVYAS